MSPSPTLLPQTPLKPTGGGLTTRSLLFFFGGLIGVYVIAACALPLRVDGRMNSLLILAVMFAPTVGALLARRFAGARIQWGRPSWWILVGLAPVLAGLLAYQVGVGLGRIELHPEVASAVLATSPVLALIACGSAFGEEVGWRGFLWPALRTRFGFGLSAALIAVVWWLYHLPLILIGLYGSMAGLPAFTMALVGFALFVGVLTDRSRSLWPSVVAHGAWNALVAKGFTSMAAGASPMFTGSDAWVGEFGWPAGIAMLALGLVAAGWHVLATTREHRKT